MNIYDVAREAGVSIATVSRVLNHKDYVSEKTRKKIQEILDRNEYHPSAIARGLVTGSMKTVAIVAVDVRVPHYALTSYIMEQQLSKLGYMVIVCNTGEDKESCKKYLEMLAKRNVDGIILVGSIFNRLCDEKETLSLLSEIPIVMANGKIESPNIHSVLVDEAYGMELATRHIYEKGHKKIAYLMDKDTDAAERKAEGFLRQMRQYGCEKPENDVYRIPYGLEGGGEAAGMLLEKGYDGAIFGEDLTAVGAMNVWTKMGVDIPGQMALTGCNNSEYSYICNPKLTTVNNKGEVLSELSVQMLRDVLLQKKETATLMILPELVVRETT
ncbi:MAG: LacI family DNA-binding transcriptional regulator [Eubacteriales bacterium]|nr:LacI family DNA-binding transcriptional regulator [Eubacteriales bacterium]